MMHYMKGKSISYCSYADAKKTLKFIIIKKDSNIYKRKAKTSGYLTNKIKRQAIQWKLFSNAFHLRKKIISNKYEICQNEKCN